VCENTGSTVVAFATENFVLVHTEAVVDALACSSPCAFVELREPGFELFHLALWHREVRHDGHMGVLFGEATSKHAATVQLPELGTQRAHSFFELR